MFFLGEAELERRSFLTFVSATTPASLGSVSAATTKAIGSHRRVRTHTKFGLTRRIDSEKAFAAYTRAKAKKFVVADASDFPYAYLFYDENQNKFVDPTAVKTTGTISASKTYVLNSTLHAFNLKKDDQDKFKGLDLQLSFNAKAPNPVGDLTWIFMNAVRIFAGKDTTNPDPLTRLQNNGAGSPLSAQPTVTVTKGKLSLQITAMGQKQKGFWRNLIDAVVSIFSSPAASAVLSGFGIPALVEQALTFVDQSLDAMTEDEDLLTLWSTGFQTFGIASDTQERFKMCKGLWIAIDWGYASSTNILQNHSIDTHLQSFRIFGPDKKPIDANYFVTDLDFVEQQ